MSNCEYCGKEIKYYDTTIGGISLHYHRYNITCGEHTFHDGCWNKFLARAIKGLLDMMKNTNFGEKE